MGPHSIRRYGTLLPSLAVGVLLGSSAGALSDGALAPAYTALASAPQNIKTALEKILPSASSPDFKTNWLLVGMVALSAGCGIGTVLYQWRKPKGETSPGSLSANKDATSSSDPGLLKKFSKIREYKVESTGYTYPKIRTFYRPHHQEDKLPREPCSIPLLVFVHGLGGSITQFHSVLMSLVNLAPTLAIDFPGCGNSAFEPQDWGAYTTDALVHLLARAIEEHRDAATNQGVVLVGHSMGCSLAALLASSTSPHAALISKHVLGLIAICPQAQPVDEKHAKVARWACSIPAPIFDLMRKWDRRGGINSKSVLRMAGPDADKETKKLQRRFNEQSRTPVWQRMMYGMLPNPRTGTGGLPGKEVWAGLQVPVFLLGGEADTTTPPQNIKTIVTFLGRDVSAVDPPSEKASMPIAAAPIDPALVDPTLGEKTPKPADTPASDAARLNDEETLAGSYTTSPTLSSNSDGFVRLGDNATFDGATPEEDATDGPLSPTISKTAPAPHARRLLVKTTIFPKPAAHSLIFAPCTARILAGLVSSFFSDHIDPRLSLSWQLQYLTTGGKWEVKNLEKWRAVQPVSLPIGKTFRAMKTLREVDERHSPKKFVEEYKGQIRAVVDISHDSPVYDPKGLEEGGIKYYKFPTVSKLPPSNEEVEEFIAMIDRVNEERQEGQMGLIGVHCHYGFNRTGYFLVCYMVERLGYRVEDAIDEFGRARPPGIKHAHFIDALHVRYYKGLQRAPTL